MAPAVTEYALLIAAIASLIGALSGCVGVIVSWRNSRKIKEVHDLTNSKMTDLINEVREGATDKATLAERAKVAAAADKA